jgi:hypothetical protein
MSRVVGCVRRDGHELHGAGDCLGDNHAPRSGLCRVHQGLPLEARGPRLMARGGFSEPRGRALGLLDCSAFQKPLKFVVYATSLSGGGLHHGAEQECCCCETLACSVEDGVLGGIDVFLDMMLDVVRLRPLASIEGFASSLPLSRACHSCCSHCCSSLSLLCSSRICSS